MARRRSGMPLLVRLGLALLVSGLAGVLLAAVALPLVGGVGLLAKSQADGYSSLPTELQTLQLSTRSIMLAADGSTIATFFRENRLSARLEEVPVSARQALVAIEDSRFYSHHGVDFKGTARAAARNGASGGVRQGGSTLTQQYVKNVLLEQARTDKTERTAARERSFNRKLREARYALALEKRMSKDDILESYLNIAYYGNGVYGIKTAAAHYFDKPVQKLTLAEGALLAGMVQNPNGLDPSDPKTVKAALARRSVVLARMDELAIITPAQDRAARREPLRLRLTTVASGCEAAGVPAPFFCDYVRRQLTGDTAVGRALGATTAERSERLLGGGLTIHTTLDLKAQRAAQKAVDKAIPRKDPSGVAAVADLVEPGTGQVKAMAVNRTYGAGRGETKVALATGGNLGFQGGSTFKAFVLTRALQMGIPLSTQIDSPAKYTSKVLRNGNKGFYEVSNAGEAEAGVYDLVTATADSVNTFYVQLEERTGFERPAALAESLGVHLVQYGRQDVPLPRVASFTLGTAGVSPLDMAGAYATFAAHGTFCPPRPVSSVDGSDGAALPLSAPSCNRVIEAAVADTVTSVLRGVVDGPAPKRTGRAASLGRPAAGKTGTAQDSKSTWFVGYTPQLAAAVWVGKATPTPLKKVTINNHYYKAVYGGSIAAPIFRQAMTGALKGVPPRSFKPASAEVAFGAQVGVPDVSGLSYSEARRTLVDAGFGVRRGGFVSAAPVPYGAVGRTRPSAGTDAPAGTTVTVQLSNGRQFATQPTLQLQLPVVTTPVRQPSVRATPRATRSARATSRPRPSRPAATTAPKAVAPTSTTAPPAPPTPRPTPTAGRAAAPSPSPSRSQR